MEFLETNKENRTSKRATEKTSNCCSVQLNGVSFWKPKTQKEKSTKAKTLKLTNEICKSKTRNSENLILLWYSTTPTTTHQWCDILFHSLCVYFLILIIYTHHHKKNRTNMETNQITRNFTYTNKHNHNVGK